MKAAFGLLLLVLLLDAPRALAHPLAPVLLELRQLPAGETAVTWKTPLVKPPGPPIRPILPADCRMLGAVVLAEDESAQVERWRVGCEDGGWVGRTVAVEGLAGGGTSALVRVALADGRVLRALLSGAKASFTVPARPSRRGVAVGHLGLGAEHLLTGLDHLLFVLGLWLVVRGRSLLLWTITSFTVGHSITLAAATLGLVRVPLAPVEAAIAVTIVLLAAELARPAGSSPGSLARRPWAMALAFGLLHGFGFAGALSGVGLPAGEIPLALLSFNAGIELGQLVFVAALWLGARLLPRNLPRRARLVAAYAIGSLAALWCFERLALLVP